MLKEAGKEDGYSKHGGYNPKIISLFLWLYWPLSHYANIPVTKITWGVDLSACQVAIAHTCTPLGI
jgi:hypothetical protein